MIVQVARDQLLEIKGVFDSLKVPFWLSGGTLLGAIRDKDLFEWDHDIDLFMLHKDYYPGFEKHFTGFTAYPLIYYINKVSLFDLKKNPENPALRINVFLGVKNPEKGVYMKLAPPLVNNAKTLWKIEDVETPCYVDLLGEKFRVPNDPEKILESHYGDWRTPIKEGLEWRKHWVKLDTKEYLEGLEW